MEKLGIILMMMYSFPVYPVCVVYCIYKFNKSTDKISLDGVTGKTPGFEAIASLFIAPFIVLVQMVIKSWELIKTLIKGIKKYFYADKQA